MRGKYIVIEGPFSCGKSKQTQLLVDAIRRDNDGGCVQTREPGGTLAGEGIREILLATREPVLSVRTEFLLFSAARAELAESIRGWLKRDLNVVSDRSWLSSLVYQGMLKGLDKVEICEITDFALDELEPDLVIYLQAKPEAIAERTAERGDGHRFHRFEPQAVVEAYDHVMRDWIDNVAFVDASGHPEEVHSRVYTAVRAHFAAPDPSDA